MSRECECGLVEKRGGNGARMAYNGVHIINYYYYLLVNNSGTRALTTRKGERGERL